MTITTPAPTPAELPERTIEVLTHPAYCCDAFYGGGFPCGADACYVSISRSASDNALSTCAECPPYSGPDSRTFRFADATLAQLLQATSLIIEHRICPPPDPEWPTPYQERLRQAGLIVRAELERRLDDLAIQ